MRAASRQATLLAVAPAVALTVALTVALAVALAACAPAAEQRGADASADTTAAATGAGSATAGATAAPSSAATAERTAPSAALGERAADSLRGVVERIGSHPTTRLVVRGADGAVCALQMTAAAALEGLEVTLRGTRDRASATMLPGVACTFAAARYVVRAVDGITAADGVLRAQGDAYALENADGKRRPLRDVPAALRTQVGARIYWAGPLDRAPAAYGVLAPAP